MGGSFAKPIEITSVHYVGFLQKMSRMDGKVVVVTGCTTGTGFVAAKAMASVGAHVLMLNRLSQRATDAEEAIKKDLPHAKVTTVACDLMSFKSVLAACQQVNQLVGEQGLDVLCNNAGIMAMEDKATEDGCDIQMQTNHLSHFIMCRELLPLLEKAATLRGEARIVHHSSGARRNPSKKLEAKYFGKNGGNLGGNGNSMLMGGARWKRYQQSKLANSVMTLALHARLQAKGSKVKAFCAAPGGAATSLGVTSNADGGFSAGSPGLTSWVLKQIAQSAEDGTLPLLTCCVSPEAMSGDMWEPAGGMKGPAKKTPHGKLADDTAACETLWTASEEVCGKFPL
ncbi:hypothetical protein T484DRAFT_2016022 [Baffinella frigidus]|nr:hypothetical protein T484DRAFT_2016022 [Cryptophyta sp. CCMP2293]